MDQPLCLTKAELEELTGRRYSRKQIEALVFMGIKFRVRPDGSPAVLRADLLAEDEDNKPKKKRVGPRLDLI